MRVVALSLVLLTGEIGAMPQADAHVRPFAECRFQHADGRWGWVPFEVVKTIRCLAPRFGVSTSEALAVADRESHFQATAYNSSSCAEGVFQHICRYWAGRVAAVRAARPKLRAIREPWSNARSNILAAFQMVATEGWGPWGG